MKRMFAIFAVLVLAADGFAQTATEKAEKRLADLLAPGQGTATFAARPIVWKPSVALDVQTFASKPLSAAPVRLPLPPRKEVKPPSAPESTPLIGFRAAPKTPKEVELPTKPLIRLPSVDVHAPASIPILAAPQKDRASLAEPAFEASLSAALKAFAPTRVSPVPFLPLNLPDPFENIRHGQMRNPPEESATPPAIPLIKPTK